MSSNKPKILMIGQENLARGGIQNVIMSIIRSFSEEYIFDVVLLADEKKDYDDEFLSYGGRIFHSPTYQGSNNILKRADFYLRGNRLYNYTRKIIKENGPYQAIHCHASLESAVFLKAAYKEKIPVRLVHSHGVHDMSNENMIRRTIDHTYISWMRRYATKLLGVSTGANLSHYGEVDALVVPPQYDEVFFNPELYPNQRSSNSLMITQVGQYCPNKNQIFSIKVLSEVIKIIPDAKLNFVGFDSIGYLPLMQKEIAILRLDDNVEFYPHDTNIPYLLSQTDAFLFPSYTEGFGIAAVEAQAMGARCYVSDTVPKTTNCGGCTYLSIGSDPSEWAQIIINDYRNCSNDRSFDCSKYSSKVIKKLYQRLYIGEE